MGKLSLRLEDYVHDGGLHSRWLLGIGVWFYDYSVLYWKYVRPILLLDSTSGRTRAAYLPKHL
jgi:hypothetical protein